MKEELGVAGSVAELLLCGVSVEDVVLPNGLIDRERWHVFALQRCTHSPRIADRPTVEEGFYGNFCKKITLLNEQLNL